MRIENAGQENTFIDLFAGCGGLSLGLLQAGWHGILAVERDSMAFETYRHNLIDGKFKGQFGRWPGGVPIAPMELSRLITASEPFLRSLRGHVDLVAGGPPCQGFSVSGKRRGDDPRNQLIFQYARFVGLVKPKCVLLENVRGIQSPHHSEVEAYSETLIRELQGLGYACFADIHRASAFGVPQERPRFLLFGVRRELLGSRAESALIAWRACVERARTEFLNASGLSERTSVRQALSDLETQGKPLQPADVPHRMRIVYTRPVTAYQKFLHPNANLEMDSMRLARHSASTERKFRMLQDKYAPGVSLSPREMPFMKSRKQRIVVLDADKPSHTLTTLPDDLLHYAEPRILTVREYARLQSFPDWFAFRGKYTTGGKRRVKECPRYTQVGNAVAPFLAEVLGMAIARFLGGLRNEHGAIAAKLSRRVEHA